MYTRPTAPRSIGGVIDDSIKLFSASFRFWLVPSLIGAMLLAGLSIWMQLRLGFGARQTPAQMLALIGSPMWWVSYGLIMLVSIWMNFAITGAIIRVSRGEAPTLGETFGASLVTLPMAILGSILALFGIGVGFVLLIVPGIYLAGRWMYWSTSLMDERGSAVDALGRSWALSKGNWWRGIAILTVVVILMVVLSMVLSFVVGMVLAMVHSDRVVVMLVTQGLQGIYNVFMSAAMPAAFAATYFDLQLRREGGDLAARLDRLTT